MPGMVISSYLQAISKAKHVVRVQLVSAGACPTGRADQLQFMFGDVDHLQVAIDQLDGHVERIGQEFESIVHLIEPIDQNRSILRRRGACAASDDAIECVHRASSSYLRSD